MASKMQAKAPIDEVDSEPEDMYYYECGFAYYAARAREEHNKAKEGVEAEELPTPTDSSGPSLDKNLGDSGASTAAFSYGKPTASYPRLQRQKTLDLEGNIEDGKAGETQLPEGDAEVPNSSSMPGLSRSTSMPFHPRSVRASQLCVAVTVLCIVVAIGALVWKHD